MARIGVFVDAGYFFAQGSVALAGSRRPREDLNVNVTAAIAELTALARNKSDNGTLLRIYWYDGTRGSRPTSEHTALAHADHIKLRLGFVNNHGQQKGVDSLIVTDLIELARNHAITDALLMSGDEDVRIGVSIAQSYGVRVHLLGIAPCRGSQSLLLMQEADTTTEWDGATIGKFMSVVSVATAEPPVSDTADSEEDSPPGSISHAVSSFVRTLDSAAVASLRVFWRTGRGLPPESDRKLLYACKSATGRILEEAEKRMAREQFRKQVEALPGPE